MNCNDCQYNSLRIILNVNVFILRNAQIFDTDGIADFKSGYIYFYFVNQCGRISSVVYFFHVFLKNTFQNFVVIYDHDLSYGMYLFIAYQCLEINLVNSACQWVEINLLDQCIVHLTFYIQHNLASFVVSL